MERIEASWNELKSGQTPVDASDQFPEQQNFWSHMATKPRYIKYEDWKGEDLINKAEVLGVIGIQNMTRCDLIKAIRELE